MSLVLERLPATTELAAATMALALLFGIPARRDRCGMAWKHPSMPPFASTTLPLPVRQFPPPSSWCLSWRLSFSPSAALMEDARESPRSLSSGCVARSPTLSHSHACHALPCMLDVLEAGLCAHHPFRRLGKQSNLAPRTGTLNVDSDRLPGRPPTWRRHSKRFSLGWCGRLAIQATHERFPVVQAVVFVSR